MHLASQLDRVPPRRAGAGISGAGREPYCCSRHTERYVLGQLNELDRPRVDRRAAAEVRHSHCRCAELKRDGEERFSAALDRVSRHRGPRPLLHRLGRAVQERRTLDPEGFPVRSGTKLELSGLQLRRGSVARSDGGLAAQLRDERDRDPVNGKHIDERVVERAAGVRIGRSIRSVMGVLVQRDRRDLHLLHRRR